MIEQGREPVRVTFRMMVLAPGTARRQAEADMVWRYAAELGAKFPDRMTEFERPSRVAVHEHDRLAFALVDILRRPWHADNIATRLGDSARLVVHPTAHHFAFISPFPAALVGNVGRPADDPAGFDRPAFLAKINEQIVRFFDEALPAP